MYREWGKRWGLESALLNDVTWNLVELARFLSDAPADLG
jgi:hypothetical protein